MIYTYRFIHSESLSIGNSAPINGHWRWAIVAHTQWVFASGFGYIMIYIDTYIYIYIYMYIYICIYIHI